MIDPLEPIDLDRLLFVDVDGKRHIGTPNRYEEALAGALVRDVLTLGQQPLGRGQVEGTLAIALAAVREGSTLPGPRSVVSAELHVHGRAWRDPDARRHAEQAVRRRWFAELDGRGLRPVGWPELEVSKLRHGSLVELAVLDGRPDYPHPGFVPLPPDTDDELVDLVCLEVRSAAVPA